VPTLDASAPTKKPRKSKPAPPVPTTLPHFLKTEDAAIHLGLAARTLEKHRTYGTGPVFRKLGGRVVYAIVDLDSWAEIGTRRSTSDRGKGVVQPAKRQPGYIVRR